MENEKWVSTHELLLQLKDEEEKVRTKAIETLYYRYKGPFYWYGRSNSLSDDQAASAANDSFTKIYRFRMNYQECDHDHADAAAYGYVWVTHKRTVIDWLRKKRSPDCIYLDETHLAPEITFPEKYMEVRRQQELIQRALESLSESERLLLTISPHRGRVSDREKQERLHAFQKLKLILSAIIQEENK